jgi:hypothetical protein
MNRQHRELFFQPSSNADTLPPKRINELGFGLDTDIISPTPDMEIDTLLRTYYQELQAIPKDARVLAESGARTIALQYAELLYESSGLHVDATTKVNLLDTAARMLQSDALTSSEQEVQFRIQHTWERIIDQTGVRSKAA